MVADDLELGSDALASGQWSRAYEVYEAALAHADSATAHEGLATALWWLGDIEGALTHGTRAYAGFRRDGDLAGAVRCAVWLAIVHKANFANAAAANGWTRRADRLLAGRPAGPLAGWVLVARGYQHPDLDSAARWTTAAIDLGRRCGSVDLELVALAQLGRIQVRIGDHEGGFALLDEAMAATLAGEGSDLDTVVYVCCDMLDACEQATDLARAEQWCRLADDFIARYGCPFLNAECRISYGTILLARGRWAAAEEQLSAGLALTGFAPALRVRARARLVDLLIRRGQYEAAAELLAEPGEAAELGVARARLALATGQPDRALRILADASPPGVRGQTEALVLQIESCVATAQLAAGHDLLAVLAALVARTDVPQLRAAADVADARLALANSRPAAAVAALRRAETTLLSLDMPYELARCRIELARALRAEDSEAAVRVAEAGLATFDSLGAGPDRDETAALLRSWGVGTPAGARGQGALTGREQQVLELLGAGLSNPEIGARLHLSRKTVAHHVSRVLSKLQLRNRAAAAAHVARLPGALSQP